MRNVVVFNNVTLDGVMQAPGRPEEDERGGFQHGGWALSRMDAVMGEVAAEGMAQQPDLLFGRRTYEDFFSRPLPPEATCTRQFAILTGSKAA